MRTEARHLILLVSALLIGEFAIPTSTANAQERRGTSGAAHLRVTPTARLSSLGSSGTAGASGLSGVEMLFANPAGLTLNQGTGVLFSRLNYLVDVDVNTLGVARQIGSNQIGLFINSWDLGEIPRQTELNPEMSSLTFSPAITTVGVTYARQFTDRISAGITVKAINENIDDMDATAVAFDGGLTYVIAETGLRFGLSVRNIGSKLTFSGAGLARQVDVPEQGSDAALNTLQIPSEPMDLPTLLNVGISYSRPLGNSLSFSLLTNFRSNSFDQDQYAAGVEVGFINVFYLRGGFELTPDQDLTLFGAGSFGAGLDLDVSGLQVAFDYAYRPTDFFSDVQLFTLAISIQ